MQITTEWLEENGACCEEVDLFAKLFPTGIAEITEANVMTAAEAGMDIMWLADSATVLDSDQYDVFYSLWDKAAAIKNAAVAPIFDRYVAEVTEGAKSHTPEQQGQLCSEARERLHADAPAIHAYNLAVGQAFWKAWSSK